MVVTSTLRNCCVLGVLLCFSACSGTPEDALLAKEALVRYQMTQFSLRGDTVADTFCVEYSDVFDRDKRTKANPPTELLTRLSDGARKVLKGSDCEYSSGQGVFEKSSARPAILLTVGAIFWKSKTSLTITGGYHASSESASGSVYHLEKRNGKWVVTKNELKWIS